MSVSLSLMSALCTNDVNNSTISGKNMKNFVILLSTTLKRAQERICADLTSLQLESDNISPIKVGVFFLTIN